LPLDYGVLKRIYRKCIEARYNQAPKQEISYANHHAYLGA
jgi:hypothetical protein